MSNQRFYFFLNIFGFLLIVQTNRSLFRILKVHCETSEKTCVELRYCRVKAINRYRSELSLKVSIMREYLEKISVRLEFFQKYSSQKYRPLALNTTIDACDFMKNRKKYMVHNMIFKLVENFTNVNHTCPFSGDIIVEKFWLSREAFPLWLPSAEFLLKSIWTVDDGNQFMFNVWFEFDDPKNAPRVHLGKYVG